MKKHLSRILAAVCTCAMLLTAASALTVEEAIELLEIYYVDDLPAATYEAETLDEVFESLGDPYTYYMDAEQSKAFYSAVESTSSVVGIGTQVSYLTSGLYITQVINNGPAEAAGLVVGDTIIGVNGISCVPADPAVVDLIRGEAGTAVTLTVLHKDGTVEDYVLVRANVVITNTNISILDGHIGLIDCDSFGSDTADLVRAGIEAHEDEVDVWWMDLRDNAGGIAGVAVETVGMFSGAGIHLYYRDGADEYYISYSVDDYITMHPVIVLTNLQSASASELFAADMRDTLAGISVGGRTYGKGVAQIILDAENEPEYFTDDALKLTGYRFYSTSSNTTDKIGVIPTLLVADSDTELVASLLQATAPLDSEGWLKVNLCGWDWYVELPDGEDQLYAAAFDAFLAALAPDVTVSIGTGTYKWTALPVEIVIGLYAGDHFYDRWFSDVSDSAYATEINALATYGILWGNGDGTYNPAETLTRAQLCAMLAQALGITTDSPSVFTDVADDSWYCPSVMAMYILGFVEGNGDGTFDPNGTVTNEQFVTIMARLGAFLNAGLYDAAGSFDEEDLADERLSGYADWAKEGACMMLYAQELNETGALAILYDAIENVDPSEPALREEAGATLYNLLSATGILRY